MKTLQSYTQTHINTRPRRRTTSHHLTCTHIHTRMKYIYTHKNTSTPKTLLRHTETPHHVSPLDITCKNIYIFIYRKTQEYLVKTPQPRLNIWVFVDEMNSCTQNHIDTKWGLFWIHKIKHRHTYTHQTETLHRISALNNFPLQSDLTSSTANLTHMYGIEFIHTK